LPDLLRCRRVAPRLWGYLAADLDPVTEDEVEHHLDACGACCDALSRIETVCQLLRAYPPGTEMPETVHARLAPLLLDLERAGSAPVSLRPAIRVCVRQWDLRRSR
jgi:hypothetical protein